MFWKKKRYLSELDLELTKVITEKFEKLEEVWHNVGEESDVFVDYGSYQPLSGGIDDIRKTKHVRKEFKKLYHQLSDMYKTMVKAVEKGNIQKRVQVFENKIKHFEKDVEKLKETEKDPIYLTASGPMKYSKVAKMWGNEDELTKELKEKIYTRTKFLNYILKECHEMRRILHQYG